MIFRNTISLQQNANFALTNLSLKEIIWPKHRATFVSATETYSLYWPLHKRVVAGVPRMKRASEEEYIFRVVAKTTVKNQEPVLERPALKNVQEL
jgi:hypothetical protein